MNHILVQNQIAQFGMVQFPEVLNENRGKSLFEVHPKLDLVTTRYSELHDLANKPQLPFIFYTIPILDLVNRY